VFRGSYIYDRKNGSRIIEARVNGPNRMERSGRQGVGVVYRCAIRGFHILLNGGFEPKVTAAAQSTKVSFATFSSLI